MDDVHVVCDIAVTCIFIGFIAREQVLLMQPHFYDEKPLEKLLARRLRPFQTAVSRSISGAADRLETFWALWWPRD